MAIAPPHGGFPMLSPGHGASLSTTAGITAVITGVMAVALTAQIHPGLAGLAAWLAGGAITALSFGAWGLYEARNAVGAALDAQPRDAILAGRLASRALMAYHFGMVGVFGGLALAAAWRVALPLGGVGWLAPLLAAGAALAAAVRAATWLMLPPPVPTDQ